MTVSPDALRLRELAVGAFVAQALHVATRLGIADVLEVPRTSAEIARAVGAHELSIQRLLRALASVGVFAERADGCFEMTRLAEPLGSRHPTGFRDLVLFLLGNESWRAWGELLGSVRTGETAFERVFDAGFFEHGVKHPEVRAGFDRAMTARSRRDSAAVVAAYDFARFRRLVDVGGGEGTFTASILAAVPGLAGVILDLPAVVASGRGALERAGVLDRCELVAGDFFKEVPTGGDVYVLFQVIHDWDEERARSILRNVREAAGAGLVLLIERLIAPGNAPDIAKWMDLQMLALFGGRERTEQEYRELVGDAGLELRRIVPTSAGVSILECSAK